MKNPVQQSKKLYNKLPEDSLGKTELIIFI